MILIWKREIMQALVLAVVITIVSQISSPEMSPSLQAFMSEWIQSLFHVDMMRQDWLLT